MTTCVAGASHCVLRPANIAELAAVVRACHDRRLAVCPQSGNTGLVGGSVGVHDEIVVSMSRIAHQFDIDPTTGIMHADAGFILQTLDEKCAEHGFMMPLDLVGALCRRVTQIRARRARARSAAIWRRPRAAFVCCATVRCTHTFSA